MKPKYLLLFLLGCLSLTAFAQLNPNGPRYTTRSALGKGLIPLQASTTDQHGNIYIAYLVGPPYGILPNGDTLFVASRDDQYTVLACYSRGGQLKRYRKLGIGRGRSQPVNFLPTPGAATLKLCMNNGVFFGNPDTSWLFPCQADTAATPVTILEFDTLFNKLECYNNLATSDTSLAAFGYVSKGLPVTPAAARASGALGGGVILTGMHQHNHFEIGGRRITPPNYGSRIDYQKPWIARLDPDGRARYLLGGNYIDGFIVDMDVDSLGNAYVTGSFKADQMEFGGLYLSRDNRGDTVNGNYPKYDVFVAAVSPLGVMRWLKRIGGRGSENANGIRVSPNGKNIYVSFSYSDSLRLDNFLVPPPPLNPGGGIVRLDRNGNVKQYTVLESEPNVTGGIGPLQMDTRGNLYFGTSSSGFARVLGSPRFNFNGGGALVKCDSNFRAIWYKTFVPINAGIAAGSGSIHVSPVNGSVYLYSSSVGTQRFDGVDLPLEFFGGRGEAWLAVLDGGAVVDSSYLTQSRPAIGEMPRLYPNPVPHNSATLVWPGPPAELHLMDTKGQVLRVFAVCPGAQPLPLSGLKPGLYLLQGAGRSLRMVIE